MSTTGTGASQDTDDARVLRKIRLAVLPAVFLLYTFNYLDRASVSYAQLRIDRKSVV